MDERSRRCRETGRTSSTAELARGSEIRFHDIQAACDAGIIPDLRQGDVIYLDTELYVSHGRDDFRGGMTEVVSVRRDISGGKPTLFLRVAQQNGLVAQLEAVGKQPEEIARRVR